MSHSERAIHSHSPEAGVRPPVRYVRFGGIKIGQRLLSATAGPPATTVVIVGSEKLV
jgi:hypothetical protein